MIKCKTVHSIPPIEKSLCYPFFQSIKEGNSFEIENIGGIMCLLLLLISAR